MSVRFLHVMPASKYTIDYIDRINKLYNPQEHYFIIYNCKDKNEYRLKRGVITDDVDCRILHMFWAGSHKAEHVFFQSLNISREMLILAATMSVKMKGHFSWYVWGSDLIYEHELEMQIKGLMLKKRVKRLCRKIIIKNLYQIITIALSDYEYALNAYKTTAKGVIAYYSYNMPPKSVIETAKNSRDEIMVGHSASPRIMHKEIYQKIFDSGYKGSVVSVLSYGADEGYIDDVIAEGRRLFGDRYRPITDWMSYEEYINMLSELDSSVFSADRQNGAGNIMYLLYLGKKVFLHKKNGMLDYLKGKGVTLYSIEEISVENLTRSLTIIEIENNRRIIGELCSDTNFKKEWDVVFDV